MKHFILALLFAFTALPSHAARKTDTGFVRFKQGEGPAATPTGFTDVYCKADGKCYRKDVSGTEQEIGSGAGGGGGAKNYIKNPSAKDDATTGVTWSNVTAGRNTTAPTLDASSEFSFTIDSAADVVTWAADAFDGYLKNTGICSASLYATVSANGENLQLQVYRNGQVIGSKNLYTTSNPAPFSIIFPCGDLTNATTFRMVGTAATTSAVKVAKVFLGEAEVTKEQVGSSWEGGYKFTNCGVSATWQSSSTNTAAPPEFPTASGCTITRLDGTSPSITAPASMLPGLNIAPEAGMKYVFVASGLMGQYGSVNSEAVLKFFDGTNYQTEDPMNSAQGGFNLHDGMTGSFVFGDSSTRFVRMRGAAFSGTATVYAGGPYTLTINVYKFPKSSNLLSVKAQNGNVDTISYSPVMTNITDNGNFRYTYSLEGEYINLTWNFISGSAPAATMSIGLPSGMKIDFEKLGTVMNSIVGRGTRAVGTSANAFSVIAWPPSAGGSDTAVYFGVYGAPSLNPATPSNTNQLIGAGELVNFTARIPIKGRTKSNTTVNMSGDPGLYQGRHNADCAWTASATSTSMVDYQPDGSCTTAQVDNLNFGTVTLSSTLPQLDFTPKYTGRYFVCASTGIQGNTVSQGWAFQLVDGSRIIDKFSVYSGASSGQNIVFPGKFCGPFEAVAGNPKTLKIQGSASAGFTYLGNQSGFSAGTGIEWTLYPLTTMAFFGAPDHEPSYSAEVSETGLVRKNSSGLLTVPKGSSVPKPGTGQYTIVFPNGKFSDDPACIIQNVSMGTWAFGYPSRECGPLAPFSKTGGTVLCAINNGSATDLPFTISCQGPKGS